MASDFYWLLRVPARENHGHKKTALGANPGGFLIGRKGFTLAQQELFCAGATFL